MYIIQGAEMNDIHAGISIGVTELRESPTRILKRAEDENQAVAILNHNKPAGYIISPRMMEAMLDSIAERLAETRAKKRLSTLNKARKVTLDEL
ncbi:MAG: type II toxin-antitoxin system prevent-host-death family antitoxin [Gallionellaceae bacterium]